MFELELLDLAAQRHELTLEFVLLGDLKRARLIFLRPSQPHPRRGRINPAWHFGFRPARRCNAPRIVTRVELAAVRNRRRMEDGHAILGKSVVARFAALTRAEALPTL
jgi:hypothetical protein